MKNIIDIYNKYKVPPLLQLHQLRVAAVAQLVCDNLNHEVNTTDVVTAMLLHDMGNIIKFKMNILPEFFEPEGVEYWAEVKEDFIKRYGSDEDKAHQEIARELGVSDEVSSYISGIAFEKLPETAASETSWEQKVCQYSDLRVGPFGVMDMHDRMDEGAKRNNHPHTPERQLLVDAAGELESQIFVDCKLTPSDITDECIAPIVEELRDFQISTRG